MGWATRPLHDPGNHRPIERGPDLHAVCRGSMRDRPNPPEGGKTTPLLNHSLGWDPRQPRPLPLIPTRDADKKALIAFLKIFYSPRIEIPVFNEPASCIMVASRQLGKTGIPSPRNTFDRSGSSPRQIGCCRIRQKLSAESNGESRTATKPLQQVPSNFLVRNRLRRGHHPFTGAMAAEIPLRITDNREAPAVLYR